MYFIYTIFEPLWSKFRILILDLKNFKVVPRMRQEENVLLGGPKSSTTSQKCHEPWLSLDCGIIISSSRQSFQGVSAEVKKKGKQKEEKKDYKMFNPLLL